MPLFYQILGYRQLLADCVLWGNPQFDDIIDGLGIIDASAGGFAGILFGDLDDSLFGENQRAQFCVGALGHLGGALLAIGGGFAHQLQLHFIKVGHKELRAAQIDANALLANAPHHTSIPSFLRG